jgi:hypothetical protein
MSKGYWKVWLIDGDVISNEHNVKYRYGDKLVWLIAIIEIDEIVLKKKHFWSKPQSINKKIEIEKITNIIPLSSIHYIEYVDKEENFSA